MTTTYPIVFPFHAAYSLHLNFYGIDKNYYMQSKTCLVK